MSATKRAAAAGLPPGPGGYLTRPPDPGRIAACFGLFVLGGVIGAAGALLQAAWFPGGLFLALAAAACLFRGGGMATGTRPGTLAPAAGWLIVVVLLTATRPEGDFLFGAGVGSYLFLLGGLAVAVICATLPPASKGQGEPRGPGRPGEGGARLGK
ncbi:DUF6113 family protein [Streptomyces sp. TS71-3]|uniref:DUF6113 family protein n=1 Tax=Streptomyces sp. TS71-3 TaxID=2733862 RepID=UPI002017E34B|nr:DUF6113 family protein [Streptomyces sp. TS71-3]